MMSLEMRVLRAKVHHLHVKKGQSERQIAHALRISRDFVRRLLGRAPGELESAPCECPRCARLKWVRPNIELRRLLRAGVVPPVRLPGTLGLFAAGGPLEGIPVTVQDERAAKALNSIGIIALVSAAPGTSRKVRRKKRGK